MQPIAKIEQELVAPITIHVGGVHRGDSVMR